MFSTICWVFFCLYRTAQRRDRRQGQGSFTSSPLYTLSLHLSSVCHLCQPLLFDNLFFFLFARLHHRLQGSGLGLARLVAVHPPDTAPELGHSLCPALPGSPLLGLVR